MGEKWDVHKQCVCRGISLLRVGWGKCLIFEGSLELSEAMRWGVESLIKKRRADL
jgi:hypothetical protein